MSIPNFKSQDDWQEFLNIFDDQWQCKKAMLDRVKDDLFPGYSYKWDELQPQTLEVINDIVSNLVYECERQFKENHQDYRDEEDEMFIPRRTFKEDVTEALLEANQKFWNSGNECPPQFHSGITIAEYNDHNT